jgi:hypothetical protein
MNETFRELTIHASCFLANYRYQGVNVRAHNDHVHDITLMFEFNDTVLHCKLPIRTEMRVT